MAYDERLAARIRRLLADRSDVEEKKMFGGLAFMVRGHMCCGLVGSDLMIRVDPDSCEGLLREPHARPMDFTGRPMRGFLYIGGAGLSSAAALRRWVGRAVSHAAARPPKANSRTGRRSA